jgi:hypothetical protein
MHVLTHRRPSRPGAPARRAVSRVRAGGQVSELVELLGGDPAGHLDAPAGWAGPPPTAAAEAGGPLREERARAASRRLHAAGGIRALVTVLNRPELEVLAPADAIYEDNKCVNNGFTFKIIGDSRRRVLAT